MPDLDCSSELIQTLEEVSVVLATDGISEPFLHGTHSQCLTEAFKNINLGQARERHSLLEQEKDGNGEIEFSLMEATAIKHPGSSSPAVVSFKACP